MELIAGESVVIDGIVIRLGGSLSRVHVTAGSPTLAVRGTRGDDIMSDLLAGSGLRVSASIDVELREIPARTRGEAITIEQSQPRIILQAPPLGPDESGHVMLVEEDGELRWIFATPDSNLFVVDLDADQDVGRGLVGWALRKAIKFLAVKALKPLAGRAPRSLVALAEERLRPTRVRTFTAADFRQDEGTEPALADLAKGPALLLIHGTNSRSNDGFGRFDERWIAALNTRYSGRVFAFDHPTLSVSPQENADRFAAWVQERLGATDVLHLDVLAHSRGGLVARELAERPRDRISVRSIVFVATPNNGTSLCDAPHLGSLVDTLTNLAAVIPDNPVTDALEVIFELVKEIALGVIYDSLPGIKAMSPTSAYLAALNQIGRPLDVPYRAIAANFEPLNSSGTLLKLRNRLLDKVFDGAMNDLVVPTRSAYLRNERFAVPPDQRVVFDSSLAIDHSGFWTVPETLARLDDWLRDDWPARPPADANPATSDPNAEVETALATADSRNLADAVEVLAHLPAKFAAVADQIVGGPVARPRLVDKPIGAVVLLPGIMGSLLESSEGRIWIAPWTLSRGGFERLILPDLGGTVSASGLNPTYAPLAARLAQKWDVHLFPFDWRQKIVDSADALDRFITTSVMRGRTERPVHLVAHSMGGLVARAFIGRHAATWRAMDDGPKHARGGRLIMLGTPNRGSYAIPLAFAGDDMIVKGIAAIDREHDRAAIRSILTTFPGMYQMLPAPALDVDDDHDALFDVATWGGAPVDPTLLLGSQQFHVELEASHASSSPERMVYIAGDRHMTPARIRVEAGVQHFGRNDEGDGRVLHRSGKLDDVAMYYVEASHGGLVSDPTVLGAIDDLLQTGTSKGLRTERFPRRSLEVGIDADDRSTSIPGRYVDPEPRGPVVVTRGDSAVSTRGPREIGQVMAEATSLYLGSPTTSALGRRQLRVTVTHASLEQAAHPVIVGHYQGIPLEGAEAVLDRRLERALSRHHDMDDYPSRIGDALFVESLRLEPPGGIVIGLGEFGDLTRSRLTRAVTRAAVQRVLRAMERPADERGPIGISAVLVSTPGNYGLTIEAAVGALVEGAAQAIIELAERHAGEPNLEELEIIELYGVRASHAVISAKRVASMLSMDVQRAIDLVLPDQLTIGRGGRPGVPVVDSSGGAWPRFVVDRKLPPRLPAPPDTDDTDPCGDAVATPPPRLPRLEFTRLGRGAQVDRLSVEYDSVKVNRMIAAAVRNPDAVDESFALFELLFPHDEKLEIDDTDNLQLLVDEDTASIPWEMLCGRGDGHVARALAIRTGMLRQLRPAAGAAPVRRTGRPPIGKRALVIGDPPAGPEVPRLPGARREAIEVARLLAEAGYTVEQVIFPQDADPDSGWLRIQTALVKHPYRVIHFATHGTIDDEHPERTGLLIGPDVRLTAVDLKQMSATPDLVFVNACHVGRTGTDIGAPRSGARVNEIAANLGLQLMRNGVKAVIAAGWAVDDGSALTFAKTVYEELLVGRPYGSAVHTARQRTVDGGRTNTWGAYQCYGDPSFSLYTGQRRAATTRPISVVELVERLDVASQQAGDATELRYLQWVNSDVRAIDNDEVARFATVPVYEALGRAYGEMGCHADAVWAYRRAAQVDAGLGRVSLVALEQLSNMEVRLAADIARQRPGAFPVVHPPDTPDSLFDAAASRLDHLLEFERTAERLKLKGSYFKKRATTVAPSQRRPLIRDAVKVYREAFRLELQRTLELDAYSGCVWIQLSTLVSSGRGLDLQRAVIELLERQVVLGDASLRSNGELLDALLRDLEPGGKAQRWRTPAVMARQQPIGAATPHVMRSRAKDFWDDAARGDVALASLMLTMSPSPRADGASSASEDDRVVAHRYIEAFTNRSTIRERDSVLNHMRDLVDLATPQQRKWFGGLFEELDRLSQHEAR